MKPDLKEIYTTGDAFWLKHQLFLQRAGYQLRPKYCPGYQPTWRTRSEMIWSEDFALHRRPSLMDATRVVDGKVVMLKHVFKQRHPFEVEIGLFFSTPPRSSDPRNHCIPIYDLLTIPDEEVGILVMPLLRSLDEPPFDTVGEVVECIRQILEGVQFMHQNYVAHRDCNSLNIMMDATTLYPQGFSAPEPGMTRDFKHLAEARATRTQCWPKYYLIDFGLSRRYNPDDGLPLEDIIRGGDKSPPEHGVERTLDVCNPFPTDIYFLGNMIREQFLDADKYDNPQMAGLEFLRPLVREMLHHDPSQRPTIDDVVVQFEETIRSLKRSHLRSLAQLDEWDSMLFPLYHLGRRVKFCVLRTPPLPRQVVPARRVLPEHLRAFFTLASNSQAREERRAPPRRSESNQGRTGRFVDSGGLPPDLLAARNFF